MKNFEVKTKVCFGERALDRLAQLSYRRALVVPKLLQSAHYHIVPFTLSNTFAVYLDYFSHSAFHAGMANP